MKTYSSQARAALAAGDVVVSGAIRIGLDEPARFWGGFGTIVIDGEAYVGVGDRGLASVSSGAVGTSEQGARVTLSGIDPEVVSRIDVRALRGVPAVIYRLIFDSSGTQLLHAAVFLRGRVDQAPLEDVAGGQSQITLGIESAARGLGRRSERMRTDADQRMISETDGGLRRITFAGEKQIHWGGQPPVRSGSAFGGAGGNVGGGASDGRGGGYEDTRYLH